MDPDAAHTQLRADLAAQVMLDRLAGVETERTRLEMVRSKPLPFPTDHAARLLSELDDVLTQIAAR